MSDSQYSTLLSMIGGLTTAVADLPTRTDITSLRNEIREGFASMEESHQQILDAISHEVTTLQDTSNNHETRLLSLEQQKV